MNLKPSSALFGVSLLALLLSTQGCLKTRAQLREDGDESEGGKPQPAHVQEVQPQGQYVLDEIRSELTRLNGRIEDLERSQKHQAASTSASEKDENKKLQQRIVELENAQSAMLEALKKLQEAASLAAADPAELLEKAKAQFSVGSYPAAIETLNGYLGSPKAKNPEEATFLRAESYFALREYKKAIQDYSKFPEKFTRSKLMATALQRIGFSFEALGMKEDARNFYLELVEKFPKSPEAKKVRAKLKNG